MKYQAILFDMDGTLVPMDIDAFTNGYFKGLTQKLAHHGIPAEMIVKLIWAGTKAMVKNDGATCNEDVFWAEFLRLSGKGKEEINDDCLSFYTNEFNSAKALTGENPLAKRAVEIAHQKADKVVLATNPVFPRVGQLTRAGWVGLSEFDFDYVSCYEHDRFCKPNPAYYLDLCSRLGVSPERCLMIGNDEREDMYAASQAGLDVYLVTDCLIPYSDHPHIGKRGTFEELVQFLSNL